MGTLRDEAYEKLDYLSQLTEVVIGPQNEALASVPDRIELSLDDILTLKVQTWGYNHAVALDVGTTLYYFMKEQYRPTVSDIKENFDWEVSPDFELNFTERKVTGTIALVKLNNQMDEKKILELAVQQAQRLLQRYDWPTKQVKTRAVTILNMLENGRGNEWLSKMDGKPQYAAWEAITQLLKEVILENKWRIRDSAVITKMGGWINSYMSHSETDPNVDNGLVNLMKLKLMVNKDLPVYSVQEVK